MANHRRSTDGVRSSSLHLPVTRIRLKIDPICEKQLIAIDSRFGNRVLLDLMCRGDEPRSSKGPESRRGLSSGRVIPLSFVVAMVHAPVLTHGSSCSLILKVQDSAEIIRLLSTSSIEKRYRVKNRSRTRACDGGVEVNLVFPKVEETADQRVTSVRCTGRHETVTREFSRLEE